MRIFSLDRSFVVEWERWHVAGPEGKIGPASRRFGEVGVQNFWVCSLGAPDTKKEAGGIGVKTR